MGLFGGMRSGRKTRVLRVPCVVFARFFACFLRGLCAVFCVACARFSCAYCAFFRVSQSDSVIAFRIWPFSQAEFIYPRYLQSAIRLSFSVVHDPLWATEKFWRSTSMLLLWATLVCLKCFMKIELFFPGALQSVSIFFPGRSAA